MFRKHSVFMSCLESRTIYHTQLGSWSIWTTCHLQVHDTTDVHDKYVWHWRLKHRRPYFVFLLKKRRRRRLKKKMATWTRALAYSERDLRSLCKLDREIGNQLHNFCRMNDADLSILLSMIRPPTFKQDTVMRQLISFALDNRPSYDNICVRKHPKRKPMCLYLNQYKPFSVLRLLNERNNIPVPKPGACALLTQPNPLTSIRPSLVYARFI